MESEDSNIALNQDLFLEESNDHEDELEVDSENARSDEHEGNVRDCCKSEIGLNLFCI